MKIYITGLPSGYDVEHLTRLFYPMAPLTLTPPQAGEDCVWASRQEDGSLSVLVREKGAEQPEGQPYDAARQAFDEAFALIGGDWSPAQEILGGILDFIAAEATIETAQVLQRRWEDEVLNSPTVLFGRGGGDAIFGETGVVPVFVQKNLGSLLSHRGGVPVPSLWEGSPFPFDDEKYARILSEKMRASNLRENPDTDFILDFQKSFR